MAIDQISTANTFEEWLTTTSLLVAVANNLTDGIGGEFLTNASINIANSLYVSGDATIKGNLTISGNVTLDSLGFDDLTVAGSVNTNNLNVETANVVQLVGSSNTLIYNTITAAIDSSIAFAIALG
jgi:hypothetical protein